MVRWEHDRLENAKIVQTLVTRARNNWNASIIASGTGTTTAGIILSDYKIPEAIGARILGDEETAKKLKDNFDNKTNEFRTFLESVPELRGLKKSLNIAVNLTEKSMLEASRINEASVDIVSCGVCGGTILSTDTNCGWCTQSLAGIWTGSIAMQRQDL